MAAGSYQGWPPAAIATVERAIAAHGGRARWQGVDAILLDFGSAAGLLPAAKGYRRTFPAPRRFEIRPHQRITLFHGYPDADHRGRFAGGDASGDVSIERASDGAVTSHSADHRATFRGLRKYRRWRPLDALYFFGYALWHYHVVPFTLPDATFVRLLDDGHGQAGVDVEFAADVPTHSRRQQFYFAADGTIARHDYVAEVVGRWARGCHFWQGYATVDGLPIALHRLVTFGHFGRPWPPTVLDVHLDGAAVRYRQTGGSAPSSASSAP